MNSIKTISAKFLPLSLVLIALFLNFCRPKPTVEPMSYSKGKKYKIEWAKVDSLEKQGLTKSALVETNRIYALSRKENNAEQVIKSLMHKAKFEAPIKEGAFINTISELEKETELADFPLKPVLHSMLAELYWQYYQRNRWKFYNRTETINFDNDDLATWDLNKLVAVTTKNYLLSVKNIDSLKHTSLNLFNEIIVRKESSERLRPTLYDFLSHRAIDFFINEEPDITRPAYQFELNDKNYLASYETFNNIKIKSKDTISLKYHGLKLLQKLTAIHAADSTPHALIDIELKRLSFVKNHATFDSSDSLYIQTLQVLLDKFESHHSSSEIAYNLASYYFKNGQKYNPESAKQYQWESKSTLEICQKTTDKFPEAYGSMMCESLAAQIKVKDLKITTEGVNTPEKPFRGLITYKNLSQVYLRLVKVDWDNYQQKNRESREQYVKRLRDSKKIKEWSISLENVGDYQQHSAEFKIDALPSGHYVLLVGSSENLSITNEAVAYVPFWVSKLSYTAREDNGATEFMVFDRVSGKPLSGVRAQAFYQKYDYDNRRNKRIKKATYITDKDGYFKISSGSDGQNVLVDFSYGKDYLNTSENFYQYRQFRDNRRTYTRTVFFTDRAIYRPGQTVFFKGIVLATTGKDNEIRTKYKSTITFYDVNHQKISGLNLTTNDYGTFSGSFTIPQGSLNGGMTISDKHGSTYFSVEEYKRPKFEVNFEPIKGSYKLEEKVTATGIAKTYSGAALDDVQVKYRVVRNANFPYWCYYRYGYFPTSPEIEIKNGVMKTDAGGKFNIDFTALPDRSVKKEFSPTYSYTVYADVVDINGETHSTTTNIQVGYNALKLAIDLTEKVDKTSFKDLQLNTTNLNGEFEPAKGEIKIWLLKMPDKYFQTRLWNKPDQFLLNKNDFEKTFPYDVYNDENNQFKWKKLSLVYTVPFNTATKKEVALRNFSKQKSGVYVLEATTTDAFGEVVKEIKYFTIYSQSEAACPVNEIDWFVPVKTKGEPGEDALFMIGSAAENVTVLFEIEHENKIIEKKWLNISNGQKKIRVPIKEKYRGNFSVHFTFVRHGEIFNHSELVTVPYTNKELDVEFSTFRNKLLPGQNEEWKITIKDKKGQKAAAEMVATLYDASLDAFRPNSWSLNLLQYHYTQKRWRGSHSFGLENSSLYANEWNSISHYWPREYDHLNWFGYSYSHFGRNLRIRGMASSFKNKKIMEDSEEMEMADNDLSEVVLAAPVEAKEADKSQIANKPKPKKTEQLGAVKARTNFNETAFFYPHLATNKNGEIVISFTIPEALTRWKFMGLAHSKDLKTGTITQETITQKDLMVYPNAPRFFRENDKMTFSSKITNLSDKDLSGEAQLYFYDALTMQPISKKLLKGKDILSFSVAKERSTVVNWEIAIPEGFQAVTYKVVAKAGSFSDGEEKAIPVLTNRMLVTESMPLPIRGNQTKTFKFDKLVNNNSTTLRNHKLTLEFTSNPAWYAVQALPYLMEYPYECAEQTFSRYYANSIASHIANSNPKIKSVFDSWKSQSPEAFLSNLEKNQELKSLLLQETPWVLNAQNESERKKRVGLLFDLNKMSNELNRALRKLQQMQVSNGGWPWFSGMRESRYITQHIVTGMGHLDNLGVKAIRKDAKSWNMVKKAVYYLDNRIKEDYDWLKKHGSNLEQDHISYNQIQYLYARSYFKDLPVNKSNQEAFNYYQQQAGKYWLSKSVYMQGMIALSLNRYDEKSIPKNILKSIKENSIEHEELGMYWKNGNGGFYWYQAPIETQALLIEAFDEVVNDKESVESMKVWLLKQKQTQDWKTTKATTEACYALLLRGTNLLMSDKLVEIKLGNITIDPKKLDGGKVEAGTGYFKTSWNNGEIKNKMGNVKITKKDDGVAWGALYWQYFEQLDKITTHETPLKLNKKLFLERNTDSGIVITPITANTILKKGDKIKVRIELRVDRAMEYIHMKDMRAAGLEPINVFSGYRYQDGLGYYQTTKDASTNFFFDFLPKGRYVFEYPLRVNVSGDFSNGITSIQSMYAPEFTSHSEGIRINVK